MGERCRLVVRGEWRLALAVIREVMGEYHAYYAAWAVRRGGGLVARLCGEPAGAVVYYTAPLRDLTLGVVYYVAVLPPYRGRGLGRVLVASAEEAMRDVDAYAATTSDGNVASKRLFSSMGYTVESWDSLEARAGPAAAEAVYLSTCAYEDDTVMTREEVRPLGALTPDSLEDAQRLWDELCLRPYLLRRRHPLLKPAPSAAP
jgi:GNAT superfamily N-acetyltransferase